MQRGWKPLLHIAEPAFFLEKVEKDEATEEFFGEVADGFVSAGLGFGGVGGGDLEALAGVGGAFGGEEFAEKVLVVLVVFVEEFFGEFFDREGIFEVLEGEVFSFLLNFGEAFGGGFAGFVGAEEEGEALGSGLFLSMGGVLAGFEGSDVGVVEDNLV